MKKKGGVIKSIRVDAELDERTKAVFPRLTFSDVARIAVEHAVRAEEIRLAEHDSKLRMLSAGVAA